MEITRLKKASDEDAFLLSTIAYEAKAFWDYPQAWLKLWKEDLTFNANFLNQHHTFIISDQQDILGFCIIIHEKEYYEVEHCWISPKHIGKGLGKALLGQILAMEEFQNQSFQVLSDPNAIGFYEKFGFKIVKMIPAKPKGRELPQMKMTNRRK